MIYLTTRKTMRDIQCNYVAAESHIKVLKKKFVGRQACWAGIASFSEGHVVQIFNNTVSNSMYRKVTWDTQFENKLKKLQKEPRLQNTYNTSAKRYVIPSDFYKNITLKITDYIFPETERYINLLVSIINEITVCYITKEKSIIFSLPYSNYDANLFLLNCLRYLWHIPKADTKLIQAFFNTLEECLDEDPMVKLTTANQVLSNTYFSLSDNQYSPGHSNIHSGVKVRNMEEYHTFIGKKDTEIRNFLCS